MQHSIQFLEMIGGLKIIGKWAHLTDESNSILTKPLMVMMHQDPNTRSASISLVPLAEPMFAPDSVTINPHTIVYSTLLDSTDPRQKKLIDLYIKQTTGLEVASGLVGI